MRYQPTITIQPEFQQVKARQGHKTASESGKRLAHNETLIVLLTVFWMLPSIQTACSQSPSFVWARSGGSTNWEFGHAIAVDANSHVIVAGACGSPANFSGTTLSHGGSLYNACLAKYDSFGALLWAANLSGDVTSISNTGGLAVDRSDNLYLTGSYSGNLSFGGVPFGFQRTGGAFLTKCDPLGNVKWIATSTSLSIDGGAGGQAVATATNGDVVFTGGFIGVIGLGSLTLTSETRSVFLAKCDAAGNVRWARQAIGPDSLGWSVALGADGSCYVAGHFEGNARFGGITLTNRGRFDSFVAKYDNDGNVLWAKMGGGSGYDYALGIAVDASQNVYVTGSFESIATFGSTSLTSAGQPDIYLAKFDTAGNLQWVRRAGGTGDDAGVAISVDSSGSSYISGNFSGTATFGVRTLVSLAPPSSLDAFVAKYTTLGDVTWVRQVGSTNQTRLNGVAVDVVQNVYLGGDFYNYSRFDQINLTAAGVTDLFVAKLPPPDAAQPTITTQPRSQVVTAGSNAVFDVTADGSPPLRYQWRLGGTNLTGATNVNFSLSNAQLESAGDYTVLVTNPFGVVTSSVATLTVVTVFPIQFINATNHVWKYHSLGLDLGTSWRESAYNDSSWASGVGLFGNDLSAGYPFPFATQILGPSQGGPLTVYYRTRFLWSGNPTNVPLLVATNYVDDGAIYYLNGTELFRFNMPDGDVGFQTTTPVANPGGEPVIFVTNLSPSNLMQGSNLLAVEVHQNFPGSSDHAFGMWLCALPTTNNPIEHTLTVNVTGLGTVQIDPPKTSYALNSVVTLTASPAAGYAFISWSGDVSGNVNPLNVQMTTNKIITANFASTVIMTGTQGEGTVTKSPDRLSYDVGEQVTLTAIAGRWFGFTRWGDGPTANPRVITIGTNNSYTAIFSPTTAVETLTFGNVSRTAPVGMPAIFVDSEFVVSNDVARLDAAEVSMFTTFPNGSMFYTLDGSTPDFGASLYGGSFMLRHSATVRAVAYDASFLNSWEADPVQVIIEPTFAVNAATAGGGTVSVSPISASYRSNAMVNASATPSPGWTFLQWVGDATGTNAVTSVRVMDRDLCLQALFGTALDTTVAGSGSVVLDPVAELYPYGTVVRLSGVPQPGNFFGAWGNAAISTNNPLIFPVTNANPTVSCVFGPLSAGQVALTVLVDGRGSVATTPRGTRFPNGQSIRLTATADADQEFLGWTGDASGTSTNLALSLIESKVITANFTKRPRLGIGPCLGGWREQGFQLTLMGEFGGRYRMERSSGLMNWTPIGNFTNTYGTWQMLDAAATNDASRFYRAVEEP